jgi:hypothetical protein
MKITITSPLFHLWVIILWFLICCSLPISAIANTPDLLQQPKKPIGYTFFPEERVVTPNVLSL